MPVVADLEVKKEQIRGESNSIVAGTTSETSLRESALANALERAQADVLIEPVYTKTTQNSKITVTVKGWPANYKNFRNMEESDIELIKMGEVKNTTTSMNKKNPNQNLNEKKPAKALGIVGLVGGIIVLIATILIL